MRNQIDSMPRVNDPEEDRLCKNVARYYDWLADRLEEEWGQFVAMHAIASLIIGSEEDIDESSPVEED